MWPFSSRGGGWGLSCRATKKITYFFAASLIYYISFYLIYDLAVCHIFLSIIWNHLKSNKPRLSRWFHRNYRMSQNFCRFSTFSRITLLEWKFKPHWKFYLFSLVQLQLYVGINSTTMYLHYVLCALGLWLSQTATGTESRQMASLKYPFRTEGFKGCLYHGTLGRR